MKKWVIISGAICLGAAACGADQERHITEREQRGDTLVVRTVSGSAWGRSARLVPELELGTAGGQTEPFQDVLALAGSDSGSVYVLDAAGPAVRQFATDGTPQGAVGAAGDEEGEYRNPDALLVLPDGRLVVRDPGRLLLQVYGPDGEHQAAWPLLATFHGGRTLAADSTYLYSPVVLASGGATDADHWRHGLVRQTLADGAPVDTLVVPAPGGETTTLTAVSDDGARSTRVPLPFAPASSWVAGQGGVILSGISSSYAIHQRLADGSVRRVEREAEAVPVTEGEADDARDRIRWLMRAVQPDWTWDGPEVPAVKPWFRQLLAGRDGRVWVLTRQPGEPVPVAEIEAAPSRGAPPARWREPVVFDVFEADGTYLGAVAAPSGFSVHPAPVFMGDTVWAVVRDESGAERVVRYRIQVAGQASSSSP